MAMERIYGLTEEEQAQVEEVAVYVGTGGRFGGRSFGMESPRMPTG